uniref:HEAT repeat domain-containing protein n=2 Tax=Sandaracinus TaxID=1055688 RepID=UPI0019D4E872|nr:HEAT repeat domain-containing protein [Sandaracinus sp.]
MSDQQQCCLRRDGTGAAHRALSLLGAARLSHSRAHMVDITESSPRLLQHRITVGLDGGFDESDIDRAFRALRWPLVDASHVGRSTSDESWEVAALARSVVRVTGPVPWLLCIESTSVEEAELVVNILGFLLPVRCADDLVHVLEADELDVPQRTHAITTLLAMVEVPNERCAELIALMLEHASPNVRAAAVHGVQRHDVERWAVSLRAIAASDPVEAIREKARVLVSQPASTQK